ncbi:MAG: condensation domain-containing protein, partial [Acidobacteria bacterium]|nr:condensation domain-containing protein [Acidobacteriota bacterium]
GIIKKVFYKIMERHEILRTGLRVMGEQPVQVIGKCSRVNVPLQFMDISEMTAEEKQQRANEIMQQTAAEPFDLTEMPLFRAVHLKLDEQRHYLIISFHHVIIDGFSLDILRQEFFGFYNQFSTGESFAPEPLKLQYKDFAQWQNKKIADPEFKENSQRYWQKKLEAGIPTLELPHDFAGDKKDKRSAIYRCVVDKELTEKLEVLAKANNTSLFTVLFCAYNIVLSHFSGQNEIWSYIVNSGRDHPSLENIVGYFVNSILLGTQVKPDENYIDLLQRVSGDFREALRYQQYAIELVLGGLKMKYPDIVVSFNLLNTNEWDAELAALDFSHMPDMGQLHFNTDIELYARKYKNGIELNWRYKKSLFKPETIENVANGFLKLGRYITEEEEE